MLIINKLLVVTLGLKWQSSIKKDMIAVDRKPQVVIKIVNNISVIIVNIQTYILL